MSNDDVSSLSDTIVPKSDQINAEQLLSGPLTITVTNVTRSQSPEQPLDVHYEGGNGRVYRPCKSMRKVLIFAWGDDGRQWIGRSITLYCDPEVKFGGVKVGGIRISHLSDIERDISISLTATKGKKAPVIIRKLQAAAKPVTQQVAEQPASDAPSDADVRAEKKRLLAEAGKGMAALQAAWKATPTALRKAISPDGTCPAALKDAATAADEAAKAAGAGGAGDDDIF